MCITAKDAKLSKTKIGLIVNHINQTHTLLYQNNVKNNHAGANCMILPILGSVRGIEDSTPYDKILDELAEATAPKTRGGGLKKVIVIREIGKYHVLHSVGASPEQIMEALQTLPAEKQPEISKELIAWYASYYKNPELILCCFSSSDQGKTQPIVITYIPRDFNTVFIPGADSHDGGVPNMAGSVERDHVIFLGMYPAHSQTKVDFSQKDNMPDEMKYAIWQSFTPSPWTANGDWIVRVNTKFSQEELVAHSDFLK